MARIRSIKPGFFLNEDVASLPFEWRLLFVGLWTQADREGRLEDRPARLKAALFPYDDLSITDGLGCLVNAGLISRYERDGKRIIAIPTWAKHQQPHIREAVSELAPLDESPVLAPGQPVCLGKGADPDQEGVHRARFDRFWAVYPLKVGKDAAWKEWLRRSPNDALMAQILATVEAHKASPQWRKRDGEFIPHPRTWLHQGRWQDEVGTGRRASAHWSDDCRHVPRCQAPELHAHLLSKAEQPA